jgi:hypothetical protein
MLRLLRNKRAQNTAEYALLIAIVIGAFTAMQIYLRRGLMARIKGGTDNLPGMVIDKSDDPSLNILGTVQQYEPYYLRRGQYDFSTNSSEGEETGTYTKGSGIREMYGAYSTRTGNQTVTGSDREDEDFE